LIINGEHIRAESKFNSLNPSNPAQVVGVFQKATPELANKAIEAANEAFKSWKDVSASKRAKYLFKAAALMRKRKHEFSAMMVYEVARAGRS
jgi:1-pyrroline-5-carboxylate dehydrogenase